MYALPVVALLAVVAVASRGDLGGGGGGEPPSTRLLDYGFTLFAILYVISIPFAIWVYLIQERESRVRGGGRRGHGLLVNGVVLVSLVLLAVMLAAARRDHEHGLRLKLPPALGGGQSKRHRPAARPPEPTFQWPVLLAVLGAGGAGAAFYLSRRRRGPLRPRPTLAAQLSDALDDALDDVRAERDPRRAVIKAYARMEDILGAHGLPRHEAEAPYEYLARALPVVDVTAASLERLTALYERARFSLHEIDAAMREDAIEALTSVRDELRAAA